MKNYTEIENFNLLFNEYYERFIRFATGYVNDEQVAEDIVSEAFTTYWQNRKSEVIISKPQAYVLTIVKNKCLNHLQHIKIKQQVSRELFEHAQWKLTLNINTLKACDPDFLFSDEIQQIVDKALHKLPKKTKTIFLLSRQQGLTYTEIAKVMSLSTKSIEYHISKALCELRILLKDFVYILPFLFYFL